MQEAPSNGGLLVSRDITARPQLGRTVSDQLGGRQHAALCDKRYWRRRMPSGGRRVGHHGVGARWFDKTPGPRVRMSRPGSWARWFGRDMMPHAWPRSYPKAPWGVTRVQGTDRTHPTLHSIVTASPHAHCRADAVVVRGLRDGPMLPTAGRSPRTAPGRRGGNAATASGRLRASAQLRVALRPGRSFAMVVAASGARLTHVIPPCASEVRSAERGRLLWVERGYGSRPAYGGQWPP